MMEGRGRNAVGRGFYLTAREDCCATFSQAAYRIGLCGVLGMLTIECKTDELIGSAHRWPGAERLIGL